VCQNQTLADSHAPLAVDLKNQVREMMAAGRTDAQVVDYMVQRYGDFVLYRPPLKGTTLVLWLGPALICVGSFFFLVRRIRALGRETPPDVVDSAAARRADVLLGLPAGKDS
jgi:cytochrome c-type biogenesis protein CcmH